MTAPNTGRTTAVAAAFTAVAERRAAGGYAPVHAAVAAAWATDPAPADRGRTHEAVVKITAPSSRTP